MKRRFLKYFLLLLLLINNLASGNAFNYSNYSTKLCAHPEKVVNEIKFIQNFGDISRFSKVYTHIIEKKSIEVLCLGGSITAGSYFGYFISLLKLSGLDVVVHNHGHGATGIDYTLYCVDMDHLNPDLVLIEFAVNDDDHPKYMEALLRKALTMGGHTSGPIVALINFSRSLSSANAKCMPKYSIHGYYYNVAVLDLCPAITLCYGKGRVPKEKQQLFSLDGLHPFGVDGPRFVGQLLWSWWDFYNESGAGEMFHMQANRSLTHTAIKDSNTQPCSDSIRQHQHLQLPLPLYEGSNEIGQCRSCLALVDDSAQQLVPIKLSPNGFRVVTRTKFGANGFQKSYKRCWESEIVGSNITFSFVGTEVLVATYQRYNGMGAMNIYLDSDTSPRKRIDSYFGGYGPLSRYAGRTGIITLLTGLPDIPHNITFEVDARPANADKPGTMNQIVALLFSSNSAKNGNSTC